MIAPTVAQVMEVMRQKEYVVFDNPRGYDLNIVGIRTDDMTAETFNDWITFFYISYEIWNYFPFPATTDPGVYWRKNPMVVGGTAILKPGQYRGAYMVGKHRGYKALAQKGTLTVYRDNNKDEVLDTVGVREHGGLHAINIHRSHPDHPSRMVGRWSAGCQVFQDPLHFEFFMKACDKSAAKYGNSFTYTLLEEKDFG